MPLARQLLRRSSTSREKGKPMSSPSKFRLPLWLGACVFGAIALFFLWEEHQAHILWVLP